MSDVSKQTSSNDPRVQAALRDYMERIDRGEVVDRKAFVARHPEIADTLRSFFEIEEPLRKIGATKISDENVGLSTRSFGQTGQETLPPSKADAPAASGIQKNFGRYCIIRSLGSGAMGTVYLAEDTQLQRQVAIKMPRFEEDPTGEVLARFYREARAAAGIRHANICPVYDVGQIDGKHYISMAYIEGRPLAKFIRSGKPQPERQILFAIHKLALALQQAHDHGIVHRDLKPANIMIDKRGEPIVMDFGLARKARQEGDATITREGMILGSPAYMSPEQVEGDQNEIGPASDQYGLGVILYEMLTGQLPFRGSVMNVLAQIIARDFTRPSELRPDVDPRIEALCLRMTAKKASDRFPSLTAVADEVSAILKNPAAKSASKGKLPSAGKSPAASIRSDNGAGASAILKSVKRQALTDSALGSLEELAGKCLARRDYEQAIQIIEGIPEGRRTDSTRVLLKKARNRADEISYLICEIEDADRTGDGPTALKKAAELLKIKPGNSRAQAIQEKYSGYGNGMTARLGPLRQVTQTWSQGGWVPWSVLVFGLAVFAVMTGVIVIYLNKTALVIDVRDAGIKVEVTAQGGAVTITGPNNERIEVQPGEQHLKIAYAGLETVTTSFELKAHHRQRVKVSLVDRRLVAELENEPLNLTPNPEDTKQKVANQAAAELKLPPRKSTPKPEDTKQQAAVAIAPAVPKPEHENVAKPAVPLLVAPFSEAAAKTAQKAWAKHLQTSVEVTDALGIKLVLIPPGEFQMGAAAGEKATDEEKPQHKVRITRGFRLSACEITRGQFATFLRESGYKTQAEQKPTGGHRIDNTGEPTFDPTCNWRNPGFKQDDRHPVVVVSWHDADAFCEWLTAKTGETYRLPTEAEWEYACRAGTTTRWYCGDDPEGLVKVANVRDAAWARKFGPAQITGDDGFVFTAPVGSYRPNAFGLYDMHGNVFEFVHDWGGAGYYKHSPVDDPPGADHGTAHISRGGAIDTIRSTPSAARDVNAPSDRYFNLGFRVARDLSGKKTKIGSQTASLENGPLVAPFDEVTAKSAQRRCAKSLGVPLELKNSIGMKFLLVPPGEFQMGSADSHSETYSSPVHKVRITNPFYLGIYEVTQAEYKRVMGTNPSQFKEDALIPVDSVASFETSEFCRRLSERSEEIRAGRRYRLPTEAEWEYACRAGTETLFYFGDTITARQANFDTHDPAFGMQKGSSPGRPMRVGSYPPNAFGLFDMHGNVFELCQDKYDPDFYARSPVDNPLNQGNGAVVRGGSWYRPAVPSAFRYTRNIETFGGDFGFRVAISIDEEARLKPASSSSTSHRKVDPAHKKRPN